MALIPRRICAQAPSSASAAGESQGTEVGGDEEDESPSKSIFAWASGGGLSQSGAAGGAQVRTAPAASSICLCWFQALQQRKHEHALLCAVG